MKALITGTPVQIEGEPAEIAQLVELMSSGAVMVEHVHHWRLGLPDDQGVQQGACWCGQSKAFAPFGETNAITKAQASLASARASKAVAVVPARRARSCKRCGEAGHDARKCPQPKAEAA